MLERPSLPDETISACLRDGYGLPVAGLEFLPIGNDTNAWVYRVSAEDGRAYFAKLKRGPIYLPSLAVPRCLTDHGIESIVAPLAARTRELWQPAGDFVLILYPFIDGRTGMAAGLSDGQWVELGRILKRIHAPAIAAELAGQMERETFVPKFSSVVAQVQALLDSGQFEGPVQNELAAFWKRQQAAIRRLVQRAEELGRQLRDRPLEFVLCHTDFHSANVMLDLDNRLWIVDWDSPLLAPKERVLMFLVGPTPRAPVEPHVNFFFQGYGKADIDSVAVAYYRYEWVVQEIGDDSARVYLWPDLGEASKAEALQHFERLFEPGNVVEAAYASEHALR
jgi:spectinomycin phosphotransferase